MRTATMTFCVLLTSLSLAACSNPQNPAEADAVVSPASSASTDASPAAAGQDVGVEAAAGSLDGSVPDYLRTAIEDPARAEDRADDQRRHLVEVMKFTGVAPGDIVVELSPGSGYWTRVFSQIVGPEGHVYTIWPQETAKYSAESMAEWQKLAATPHYANVSVLAPAAADIKVPEPADLIFTSQNYHDFHNLDLDIEAFDRNLLAALKPGGALIIIDHVAAFGSGTKATDTLHRIDPDQVKQEVTAAGFIFEAASEALYNPADPHDVGVFDDAVRGHTDQFVFRFIKPGVPSD